MDTKQQRKAMVALRKAVIVAGGTRALAEICGARYGNVWNWLHRDKKVPPQYAPGIEAQTGVSKQDLCPDFPWPDA